MEGDIAGAEVGGGGVVESARAVVAERGVKSRRRLRKGANTIHWGWPMGSSGALVPDERRGMRGGWVKTETRRTHFIARMQA